MACVNDDAGWVDPTDSQDLTRGRLVGIPARRAPVGAPGFCPAAPAGASDEMTLQ